MSGSRLNTHSGKRIVSQFGQVEPETEYPSKRVVVRGQREINNAEIAANNTWAATALKSTQWAMPSTTQPLQVASDEEEEEEGPERDSQLRNAPQQAPGHVNDLPAQEPDSESNKDTENAPASSGTIQTSERSDVETSGPAPSSKPVDEKILEMISALSAQVAALSEQIQAPQHEDPRRTDIRLRRVERELKGMKSQILGVHTGISMLLAAESRGGPTSTSSATRVPGTASSIHPGNMARHEVVPSTSTVVPADAIDPANLMVVLLDDEELTFDYTRVPNPPNIHFSGDIPRLFREWESSTLLIVNGRGIAIKYWPLFYRRRKQGLNHKNGAWDKIRTVWGNWKVCRHLL
ncbi:hypothetical protein B0H10DRAFT_1959374 [Mycena sp. CBHHK59/15]|nr:hypothetical protein B0H10DRAFT_1959374 [Mycena sp. CBHHK59/15]